MANKILIIFYGGTGIFDKKDEFTYVEKYSDLEDWFSKIPEISLITNTYDSFIIEKNKESSNFSNVLKIVSTIKEKENEYDGFLIIHDVDSIPTLANQLFWLVQNPSKPIVLTGSNVIEEETEFLPDMSFKANIINSLQVINSQLKQINVVYGNRVVLAPKVKRTSLHDLNIFDSIDNKYYAKIDFGLSIEEKNNTKKETKYFKKLNENFLFFEVSPNIKTLETILSKDIDTKVVIFKAWPNQIMEREKLVNLMKLSSANKKIPVLYNQMGFGKDFLEQFILAISKITPECLCAKLSWILGQTKNDDEIKKLLKENIQGEFFE